MLASHESLDVQNPYTGSCVARISLATMTDVRNAETRLRQGNQICSQYSRAERADILLRTARIVEERQDDFARLIVSESGKTIRQAQKEVSRCVNTLTLSGEEAKRLSGEVIPFDSYAGNENRFGYFTREPMGGILAITPFNDPLNLVAHKLGPAIAGGNGVILKPSELTPLSALKLVEAMNEAGLDDSVVTVILGGAEKANALVAQSDIRMISFTGGMATGEKIIRAAGVKKFAMDLGGNAPVLVFEDCNLDQAVELTVSGAYWASGQNCIGVQRVFVSERISSVFEKAFISATEKLNVGDPSLQETDVGPMVCVEHAKRAEQNVQSALDDGAKLLTGHKRHGALYSPTVLKDVPSHSLVSCEEVFAPVVILDTFSDVEDAICKANQSPYSLHAGVFTSNLNLALTLSERIQAGGVMINDSSDFRFDGMPFGGFKQGSIGREGVRFAIEDMTQPKVVCVNRIAS